MDVSQTASPTTLVSVVEHLEKLEGDGTITVDELIKSVGQMSFAPLVILPAAALVSPLSGIPLFSSAMGVIIFLVSLQMFLRRNHIWLPRFLLSLRASKKRVRTSFKTIHPLIAWLDRRTHTRLTIFTHRPFVFVPQLLCVVSGLFLPLFEFIPFSSSLVGLAVALLAIGLFARDGAILLIALLPYAGLLIVITRAI